MADFIRENFLHVAPIIAAAFVGLAIILERFSALFWRYPLSNATYFFDRVRECVLENHLSEAISICESYSSKPLARIVKEAILRAHQPEIMLENGLELAVNEAIQEISSRTAYLSTIANVATLMGLFGTIIGLIHSFEAIGNANAQEKAALLANGISTAMNATMMGLGVAIPCMVFFSFFMSKTNKLIAEIEQAAIRASDFIHQRYFDAELENRKRTS